MSIAKNSTKPHIKHMLIWKREHSRKNVVDIAMLLDNNEYIEYSIAFKQKLMTFYVSKRIRDLFIPYFIDYKTDIMINESLNESHPLRIYLDLIRPHLNFKLRTVSCRQMIDRIYYYLDSKAAPSMKFAYVWKKTIEKGICPWITRQVDYALQNKTPAIQHNMMLMRLGAFYMVVKNYLYARLKTHRLKQKNETNDA